MSLQTHVGAIGRMGSSRKAFLRAVLPTGASALVPRVAASSGGGPGSADFRSNAARISEAGILALSRRVSPIVAHPFKGGWARCKRPPPAPSGAKEELGEFHSVVPPGFDTLPRPHTHPGKGVDPSLVHSCQSQWPRRHHPDQPRRPPCRRQRSGAPFRHLRLAGTVPAPPHRQQRRLDRWPATVNPLGPGHFSTFPDAVGRRSPVALTWFLRAPGLSKPASSEPSEANRRIAAKRRRRRKTSPGRARPGLAGCVLRLFACRTGRLACFFRRPPEGVRGAKGMTRLWDRFISTPRRGDAKTQRERPSWPFSCPWFPSCASVSNRRNRTSSCPFPMILYSPPARCQNHVHGIMIVQSNQGEQKQRSGVGF